MDPTDHIDLCLRAACVLTSVDEAERAVERAMRDIHNAPTHGRSEGLGLRRTVIHALDADAEPTTLDGDDAIMTAVRQLPVKLRHPLLLRDGANLTTAQVAAALALSEERARRRIHRARRRLRKMLEIQPRQG